MRASTYRRLLEDEGQDVTEYTLLLAFVALISAALFLNGAGSISTIWTSTTSVMAVGASR